MAYDQIREYDDQKKWIDLMNAYIKATNPKPTQGSKRQGRRGRRK